MYKMSKSEHEAVERGREAWERLKSGKVWEDWMLTGTALTIGRDECLAATHSNDIGDKRYRNAFSDWLEENGFGDMDKGERKHLFDCMEHRAEIETWRATLTMNVRLSLNHPRSVIRKWKVSTSDGHAADAPATQRRQTQKEAAAAVIEERDAALRRVTELERGQDHLTEGRDWTWQDTPEEIAAAMFRLYPTKAVRVASAILQLSKSTTKKPAVRSRERVEEGAL
jgi:hypothetical protein